MNGYFSIFMIELLINCCIQNQPYFGNYQSDSLLIANLKFILFQAYFNKNWEIMFWISELVYEYLKRIMNVVIMHINELYNCKSIYSILSLKGKLLDWSISNARWLIVLWDECYNGLCFKSLMHICVYVIFKHII